MAGCPAWRPLCVQVQELDAQLAAGRQQLQQAREELAAVRAAPDVVEQQLRGELQAVQDKISDMGEEVVLGEWGCCGRSVGVGGLGSGLHCGGDGGLCVGGGQLHA